MRTIKTLIAALLLSLSITGQVGQELYRPAFHYSPRQNWMNDPNGLVYYNGKYHLFYQYNPNGIQPGNSSWGHAVSTDLINWEEKPVAIPMQNGVMAYSGSVVVDWNNTSGFGIDGKPPLVAIYTGASSVQDQRLAYSNDEGVTWTTYSRNPVLNLNTNEFRDPKVFWHQQSQSWIMAVALGGFQSVSLYRSADLKNWSQLSGLSSNGNVAGSWECPDLFRLPVDNDPSQAKWVLVHSVVPTAQYFIGNFDGQAFSWHRTLPSGILFDDFESENYNRWTSLGTSFGSRPTTGTGTFSGYLGNKLVSSSLNGTGSLGKLISGDFIIDKNYINFLIGGGYHPNGVYIKLVINNQTVRKSTGINEDLLKWKSWNVSDFKGQTARLEIVDSVTNRWGHVNIDQIIQSDVVSGEVNYGQVDYGKDFYALQSFSDMPDGRRIWLAWMNQWAYAALTPTSPWKGIMSIPREVKLEKHNGQIRLVQKPIVELTTLRKENLRLNKANLNDINNSLHNINSSSAGKAFKQFEIKARMAVGSQHGFSLKFKKNGSLYTEIVFDFINREIRFDRSKNAILIHELFKDIQVAPLLVENGYFDLQLFVDNCSAELFTAGGQIVMSNQIFPDSSGNDIELISLGEDFAMESFDIWRLERNTALSGPGTAQPSLFRVYPNPLTGDGLITIKIKEEFAGKVTFRLLNASGMLVSVFHPAGNYLIIPQYQLAKSQGIYFLSGTDGKTIQTEKLLILKN